jgi:hypothetical protein
MKEKMEGDLRKKRRKKSTLELATATPVGGVK